MDAPRTKEWDVGVGGVLDIAGGEIEYEIVGAPPEASTGPPLVFLHEGLGSVALWRGFPAAVAEGTGRPAVVYSRHGYGRSSVVTSPRRPDYMHREADAVLPELLGVLGVERPVLVGHSDGASIALLYAGAGHAVAGLVLLAPHVFVEDRSVAGIAAAREAYDSEATGLAQAMAKYHRDADATFRGWNRIWLSPDFRDWNIENRLGAIECPVLVVAGEDDQYGTLAQLDAIERGVDGPVVRLVLAAVGHAPHLERPGLTTDSVVGFVRNQT